MSIEHPVSKPISSTAPVKDVRVVREDIHFQDDDDNDGLIEDGDKEDLLAELPDDTEVGSI